MPTGDAEITAALHDALVARYPDGEWITMTEVDLHPQRQGRKVDFLAQHTWGSRGFARLGHEIKASRSDWLRELRDPSKADPWVRRCHEWWLVTPAGVVQDGEVPLGWGHLLLGSTGKLRAVKQPERLTSPEDPPTPFAIACLRRAAQAGPGALQRARSAGWSEGHEQGRRAGFREARSSEQQQARHRELIERLDAFTRATGGLDPLRPDRWGRFGASLDDLAPALQFLLTQEDRLAAAEERVRQAVAGLATLAARLQSDLEVTE